MPYTIIYSIKDGKGAVSTTEVNLPDAVTLANAKLWAKEFAKLVNNVSTGQIVRIGLVLNVDLPASGIRTSAGATSDVEEGARFQFKTVNGFFTGLRIPTFDEDKVNAGSRDVDTTDSAIVALVNAIKTGIDLSAIEGGSGTPAPCDKRGEDVTELEFAREQFLSSR